MGFKRIVATSAIVILVAICIFMIFFFKRSSDDVVYPPVINKCPDYWDYDESGGECVNTFGMKSKKAGNATISALSTEDHSESNNGLCMKRDWSHDEGVTWDGITNNEKLDCSDY